MACTFCKNQDRRTLQTTSEFCRVFIVTFLYMKLESPYTHLRSASILCDHHAGHRTTLDPPRPTSGCRPIDEAGTYPHPEVHHHRVHDIQSYSSNFCSVFTFLHRHLAQEEHRNQSMAIQEYPKRLLKRTCNSTFLSHWLQFRGLSGNTVFHGVMSTGDGGLLGL